MKFSGFNTTEKVGIGTNAPKAELQIGYCINAPSTYGAATDNTSLIIGGPNVSLGVATLVMVGQGSGNGQTNNEILFGAGNSKSARIINFQDGAGDAIGGLKFNVFNGATETNAVTILNDGKVGIGTTTPSNLLSIHWAAGGYAKLAYATNQYAGLVFVENGVSKAYIDYGGYQATDGFSFYAGGGSNAHLAMKIKESGKTIIGGGATEPGACRLTVNGSGGFGSSSDGVIISNESGYGVIQGTDMLGNSFNGLKLRTQGYAIIIPNSAAPDVEIVNKLGIGVVAPQAKTDIVEIYADSSSAVEGLQLLIRGGQADLTPTGDSIGLGFGYGSANNYVKTGIINEFTAANGSSSLHLCTTATGGVATVTKADARLTVKSDGNVGIGTTAPAAKLHVNGTLWTQNEVYFKSIGGENRFDFLGTEHDGSHGYLQVRNSDQSVKIKLSSNGVSYFTGGNFGIGTTAPGTYAAVQNNLEVKTSGHGGIAINSGTASLGMLTFAQNGSHKWSLECENDATPNLSFNEAGTLRMVIAAGGQLKLNSYGSGTHTGTSAYKLSVDSSGNIIETSIGSGAVDGAGTANYISKWTDGDTIGNSIIYDDGTNDVGIGVVPTAVNTSHKSLQIGGNVNIQSYGTKGASGEVDYCHNVYLNQDGNYKLISADEATMYRQGSGKHTFYSWASGTAGSNVSANAAATKLIILQDGKVGIENTAPKAKLHVGTSPLVASDISTTAVFAADVAGTAYPLTLSNTNVATVNDAVRMSFSFYSSWSATAFVGASIDSTTTAYTSLIFGTYGPSGLQERMRVLGNGNVGIGTTSPAHALHVYDTTGNASAVLIDGSASNSGFLSFRQAGVEKSYIQYTSNSYLRYFAAGGHNFAQNVGIGTNTLYAGTNVTSLTINATSYPTISLNIGGTVSHVIMGYSTYLNIDAIGNRSIKLRTNDLDRLTISGDGAITAQTDQNNSTIFKVKNATASTSSDAQLRCESSSSLGLITAMPSSYSTSSAYVADSFLVLAASTCSAGLGLAAEGANPINLWTNNTKRVTVDSAGKVGIGTNAPLGILSLPGADTTTKPQIRFQTGAAANLADAAISTTDDSGGTNVMIGSNQYWSGGSITRFVTDRSGSAIDFGYAGRMKFYTGEGSAAPTERMRIERDGNVGLGTASPSSKFHIWDGSTVDAFKVENYNRGAVWNSVGAGGMYSEYQLTGTWKFRLGQANHLVSGASVNDFALSYAGNLLFATSVTERMRITSTGNVGIGATAPSQLLHVKKSSNDARVLIETTGAGAYLQLNSVTSGYAGIEIYGNSGANWSFGQYGFSDLSVIEGGMNGTRRVTFRAGGNVGIGIVVPNAKLHVHGDLLIKDQSMIGVRNSANTDYAHAIRMTYGTKIEINPTSNYNQTAIPYGSVGIGTPDPASLLHIQHATAPNIRIERTTGATSGSLGLIEFGARSVDDNLVTIYAEQDGATDAGKLTFSTEATGGALTERMTIKSDGKVGIGTTAPSGAILDIVAGDNSTPQIKLRAIGANTQAKIHASGSSGNFELFTGDGDGNQTIKLSIARTSGAATFSGTVNAAYVISTGYAQASSLRIPSTTNYHEIWSSGDELRIYRNQSAAIRIGASNLVTLGGALAGTSAAFSHTVDPGTTPTALSVVLPGMSAGTATNQYAIKVTANGYNNATNVFGVHSTVPQQYISPAYALYGETNGVYGNVYGLYTKATQSNLGGGCIAYGIYALATSASSSSTVGKTYGAVISNTASLGARAVGLYVNSTNGEPLIVDSGGSERFKITNAGTVTTAGLQLGGGVISHGSSNASSIVLCGGNSSSTTGANITLGGNSGSADRAVIFKANSTETLRIASDGNVGIGTNNPGETLHIYGSIYSRVKIQTTSANSHAILWLQNDAQTWDLRVNGANADNFEIVDSTGTQTSRFVVQTDGNVGIGTTSPGKKLEVVGEVRIADAGIPKLWFYDTSTAQLASIRHSSGTTRLGIFDDSNNERFTVITEGGASQGRVGIGTATPRAKLDVRGARSSDYFNAVRLANTDTGSGAEQNRVGVEFWDRTTALNTAIIGSRGSIGGHWGGMLKVRVNQVNSPQTAESSLTDMLVFDGYNNKSYFPTGSVGIGTNAPLNKLQIDSGSTANSANKFYDLLKLKGKNNTLNAVGMLFSIEQTAGTAGVDYSKGGIVYGPTTGWGRGAMHFLQEASNTTADADISDSVMTILNDGNVGIGTTNPGQKLHVNGNILVNAQILTPGGSNLQLNPNTGLVTVGGALQATSTLTATGATFSGAAHFGGTTEKVYMAGNYLILDGANGTILRDSGSNKIIQNGSYFRPDGNNDMYLGASGNRWANTYSVLGNFSGDVTINSLTIASGSSDTIYANRSVFGLRGNTSVNLMPGGVTRLLCNSSGITVTGNIIPAADGTYNLGSTSSQDWKELYIREIDMYNQRLRIYTSAEKVIFRDHSSIGQGITFQHRNTHVMTIGDASGNTRVGIGTTAPVDKLHLASGGKFRNGHGVEYSSSTYITNNTTTNYTIAALAYGTAEFHVGLYGNGAAVNVHVTLGGHMSSSSKIYCATVLANETLGNATVTLSENNGNYVVGIGNTSGFSIYGSFWYKSSTYTDGAGVATLTVS